MNEFISDSNLLNDISQTGYKRPWRKHKLESLAVASSMGLIEDLKYLSSRIKNCGCNLVFKSCPNGHGKKLCQADFCRSRDCILCNFRRAMIIYHQLLAIVHRHKEQFTSDIPVMLTLTVPNCYGDSLRETIKEMSNGFRRLFELKSVKNAIRGWFRSLEVTYNEKTNMYHPHYHVLMMVPANYFKHRYGLYIEHDSWLEFWQQSMRDPSITQVDIRKLTRKKRNLVSLSEAALVAEVSKYATKPSSYIKKISSDHYYANPKVVSDFHYALRNLRLLGFGGTFKTIRRDLKHEDVEKSSLIKVSADENMCLCNICNSEMFEEIYTWRFGLKNYFGRKTIFQEVEDMQRKIVSANNKLEIIE